MSRYPFVICVSNVGYEVDLEPRKLYERVPDERAEQLGQWRVIDESGEDYLYPASLFETLVLSAPLEEKLRVA